MPLAKVSKINIIGHKKDQTDILEVLQNLGFAQIDDLQGKDKALEKATLTEQISDLDYKIAGVKFSLDFLIDYDKQKKSLAEKLVPKLDLSLAEIETIVGKFDYQSRTADVQAVESKINRAKNIIDKLEQELKLISPWKKLSFIPDSENTNSNYEFKFISASPDLYSDVISQFEKEFPLSAVEKAAETTVDKKTEYLAVIFFQKDQEQKATEILLNLNVKIIEIPSLKVAISQRIDQINREMEEAGAEIEAAEKTASQLTENIKNFKICFDYLGWQREKLINREKAGDTEQTFSLNGWIDSAKIEALKKNIARETDNFAIEELPIGEDETAPIIFKNNPFISDYEAITTLYGTPQKHEPDPTPFLAPFFTLFFGMAMTDAGYGIIMAGGIYAFIKLMKIPRPKQKLLRVLMWGGVATFILGALTGGWFSIDLTTLPGFISGPLLAIQIIDPIKSPLTIFYLALGLGVLQVLFGLGIDSFWKIKDKNIIGAATGSGAWFITILFGLLFAGASSGAIPAAIGVIAKYLTYTGIILIVYGGARSTKSAVLKAPYGILALYSAVGYFSDILSYSRLLALGLTTTIIGTVVNIIAGLVFGLPYVGWLAALIVLIGGHAFNMAINALGVFIHSARLQFIEFFPKFLEAGGIPFEPFRKDAKYINLINK